MLFSHVFHVPFFNHVSMCRNADTLTTMTTLTTTTTPTTQGWLSDVSATLPGWSITLVGPGQYPRYTSAVNEREAVGSPGD